MFVVIEWNQASGRPEVATDEVFDDENSARDAASVLREEAHQVGRGETYTVHELHDDQDEDQDAQVRLIHDGELLYVPPNGIQVTRRVRVYETGAETITAVLTERPQDKGTSVTNAADTIRAVLQRRYPGSTIEQIEHYTDRATGGSDEFSLVLFAQGQRPEWRYIPLADMVARFGPDVTGTKLSPLP